MVSSFGSTLFQYSSCTTKHTGCQQLKFLSKSCCFQGLGRWLSSSEDWVQFLAPTWQFTTVFNSSSRGYNVLFQPPRKLNPCNAHIYMQVKYVHKTKSSSLKRATKETHSFKWFSTNSLLKQNLLTAHYLKTRQWGRLLNTVVPLKLWAFSQLICTNSRSTVMKTCWKYENTHLGGSDVTVNLFLKQSQ